MEKSLNGYTKEGNNNNTVISSTNNTNDNSQIEDRLGSLLSKSNIINHIHDAVIITDLNGIIISWNQGAETQFGYSSNEIIGRPIYHLYPDERKRFLTADVLHILQSKGNIDFDAEMKTKSGEILYTHTSLSSLTDDSGEIIGIVSYSLDISERRKIEQSLKESEKRFELAVAGTTDGIWDWDVQSNEVYYSPRFKELLGYTEEEFPGILNTFVDHLHPEDYDYTLDAINNHLDNKSSYDVEIRLRKKTGDYCWFRARGQALWNDAGNAIRMSGSIQDINDKKKTEIELEHYQDNLEELVLQRTTDLEQTRANLVKTNLSLQALSQSNYAMIHATDEQQLLDEICRIIVDVGNFSSAWVGYALNDKNKSIQVMASYGTEKEYIDNLKLSWADGEYMTRPASMAIRNSKITTVTDTFNDPSFEPWRNDAIEHNIRSMAAFPLLDKDNQAIGMFGFYSTEINHYSDDQIRLMTELGNNLTYGIMSLRAKKALKQKDRLAALGQLIAVVSHELRNPLGTIRTSLYTISQKISGGSNDLLEKQITRAERNVMRCDTIIEELLDFTRQSELHLEEVSLNEFCDEVINEYSFHENILLNKELSSGLVIRIDKEKIRRCLINIINNACQAMLQQDTESKKTLKLSISTGHSATKAWIDINDSGPGIPDIEIDKVFEPLYSTKNYGIGLGLPIVKQIMEKHSGGIDIESKTDEGTDMKLWFPR